MPFVETRDDVFLDEESFATWHEASAVMRTFPCTRILVGHGAKGPGGIDESIALSPDR
jgi:hypothetical protein